MKTIIRSLLVYFDTLLKLHWYLYSRAKYQTDADRLTPTMGALKYKIFRSHFNTLLLRRSHMPIQNLLSPESYGWEKDDNSLTTIIMDNLPAPMAMNEQCNMNRFKCKNNNLPCTDIYICRSNNCDNDGDIDEVQYHEVLVETDDVE